MWHVHLPVVVTVPPRGTGQVNVEGTGLGFGMIILCDTWAIVCIVRVLLGLEH